MRAIVGGNHRTTWLPIVAVMWLFAISPIHVSARGALGPDNTAGSPPRSLDQLVADAIAFRAEVGFPSDGSTVSALLRDPGVDFTFGVPLTKKELANIQRRLDLPRTRSRRWPSSMTIPPISAVSTSVRTPAIS